MGAASPSTARLAAHIAAVHGHATPRAPVVDRLADALGRDFAERVVAMLSADALDRLDLGLTPRFADRLAKLGGSDLPARFAGHAARELERGRLGRPVV